MIVVVPIMCVTGMVVVKGLLKHPVQRPLRVVWQGRPQAMQQIICSLRQSLGLELAVARLGQTDQVGDLLDDDFRRCVVSFQG